MLTGMMMPYAPDRLRCQAVAVNGLADITGLEHASVIELFEGRFWTTQRQLHQPMFVEDVHGGFSCSANTFLLRACVIPTSIWGKTRGCCGRRSAGVF